MSCSKTQNDKWRASWARYTSPMPPGADLGLDAIGRNGLRQHDVSCRSCYADECYTVTEPAIQHPVDSQVRCLISSFGIVSAIAMLAQGSATRIAGLIRHGKVPALAKGAAGRLARRPYREKVSMIASAMASAYSSSTKWPPSK
jgi:hypothetical protein